MLKQSQYNKKWREKNKEHVAIYYKKWRDENKEKRDKYFKLRNAKKALQKMLIKIEALKKLIKTLDVDCDIVKINYCVEECGHYAKAPAANYVTALSVYCEFSNSIYGVTPSGFRTWLEDRIDGVRIAAQDNVEGDLQQTRGSDYAVALSLVHRWSLNNNMGAGPRVTFQAWLEEKQTK
jgi:hypothetical protein